MISPSDIIRFSALRYECHSSFIFMSTDARHEYIYCDSTADIHDVSMYRCRHHISAREPHYLDLPPPCVQYTFLWYTLHFFDIALHITLKFTLFYIFSPFPAGPASEVSLPKFTNINVTHPEINFSGGKGLNTGGGAEMAGLSSRPLPKTFTFNLPPFPYLSTYQVILLEQ